MEKSFRLDVATGLEGSDNTRHPGAKKNKSTIFLENR